MCFGATAVYPITLQGHTEKITRPRLLALEVVYENVMIRKLDFTDLVMSIYETQVIIIHCVCLYFITCFYFAVRELDIIFLFNPKSVGSAAKTTPSSMLMHDLFPGNIILNYLLVGGASQEIAMYRFVADFIITSILQPWPKLINQPDLISVISSGTTAPPAPPPAGFW